MPGVVAAIRPRSTSGPSGTERVCTSRIASRPLRSGGCTATRRSKRPGRSSAWSSTSGRFVAAITITPVDGVEAVHLGQDLVQRLLALVVAAAEAGDPRGPRAADRVELVDEDDRRRGLLRLLEQVADARGADADDRLDELRGRHREERRVRLAGDRAGEQRLAGAGRPREQHAVRDPRAERHVLLGVAQEVDDLGQLGLRLVDPGDVGEGDGIVRAGS